MDSFHKDYKRNGELYLTTKICEHCGKEFSNTAEKSSYIESFLCKRCCNRWRLFFAKNYRRIEEKYSSQKSVFNPTWLIWTGQLKEKENNVKVQFT